MPSLVELAHVMEADQVSKAQTRNVLRVLDRNPGLLRETTREGDYARETMKRAGASVGGKRRGFGYGSVMGVPRGKPGPGVPTSFSRRPKSERQPL